MNWPGGGSSDTVASFVDNSSLHLEPLAAYSKYWEKLSSILFGLSSWKNLTGEA